MFSELESLSVYSGILRLVTMLEKKKFKDWATWLSSEMILSFSINVICSLDIILSEKKASLFSEIFLLRKSERQYFAVTNIFFCFHPSYLLRIYYGV